MGLHSCGALFGLRMRDISIGTCSAEEARRAVGRKDLRLAQLRPMYNVADVHGGGAPPRKRAAVRAGNNEGIPLRTLEHP